MNIFDTFLSLVPGMSDARISYSGRLRPERRKWWRPDVGVPTESCHLVYGALSQKGGS